MRFQDGDEVRVGAGHHTVLYVVPLLIKKDPKNDFALAEGVIGGVGTASSGNPAGIVRSWVWGPTENFKQAVCWRDGFKRGLR